MALDLLHPEDAARVRSEIEQAVSEKTAFRFLRPDGEIRWIATLGKIRNDEAGRPLRLIGTAQDITAQRRAETRLQLQGTALEAAANAMIITNRDAVGDRMGQPGLFHDDRLFSGRGPGSDPRRVIAFRHPEPGILDSDWPWSTPRGWRC